MSDRRITTDDRQHDALKHVCGLLNKLSYRDMQTLCAMLASDLPYTVSEHDGAEVAKALFATADRLLAT